MFLSILTTGGFLFSFQSMFIEYKGELLQIKLISNFVYLKKKVSKTRKTIYFLHIINTLSVRICTIQKQNESK